MTELLAEMLIDGAWVDITSDVRTESSVSIRRGRENESSNAAPASCSFTLNNRDGKYSPRNPLSPYFGKIGRNTQVRLGAAKVAEFDATSSPAAGTGTLSWTHTPVGDPSGVLVLIQQNAGGVDQVTSVTYGGVEMTRAPGSLGSTFTGVSSPTGRYYRYRLSGLARIPAGPQTVVVTVSGATTRKAVALTFTGGNAIQFGEVTNVNTSSGTASPRSQNITITRDSLFVSLLHSDQDAVTDVTPAGTSVDVVEYDFGSEVMAVTRTPTLVPPGTWVTGWDTSTAGIATISVDVVAAFSYRFWGEIASLPPRWDLSGKEAWVPIEAAGLLRRLGQGSAPTTTALRDYILSQGSVLQSYFPLSGGEGTTYSLNLGFGGWPSYRFYGQNVPGQNAVFTYGKDMGVSWIGTGMELNATGNAYMRGDVGAGEPNVAFDMVFQAVPPGLGVLTVQLQDYNTNLWSVVLNTPTDDGTLQVTFDDPNVGPIGFLTVGPFPELQDASLHHLRFQLSTVGADTQFAVYIDGTLRSSGTMSGYTLNGCALYRLFYTRYTNQTVVNIAHLALWDHAVAASIPSAADVAEAAFGFAGETAGERMDRVAGLAGIPLLIVGNEADTPAMGPQHDEPVLSTIRDAENTDLGILTETRDALALLYRTRSSMYAQSPVITIDYSAGELSPPFEPVDDDQQTRNDVTATKRDGDSFNVVRTSGPLSVQDPPNGVGRYQDEVQVNVQTDAMLPDIASWLLNIGTLDQARFPSVAVNLAAPDVAANAALSEGVLQVEVGDLIRITGLDAVGIYDDVDLIVLGVSPEEIGPVEHTFVFNCAPAAPYQVAKFGTSRFDAQGSVLTAGISSSATSFQVSQTDTQSSLWTTLPAAFPFDINVGGERMTVGGISSATSPQTFSPVTRSVNGVVKSHAANEPVRLWDTPRFAL